jgi:carbamoyltransferase
MRARRSARTNSVKPPKPLNTSADRGFDSAESEPWILGISASHNGSACLLKGQRIVVAIQEERLNRQKRAVVFGSQPSLAIEYCLEYAGIRPSDLAAVAICPCGPGAKSELQDVALNRQLRISHHGTPIITVPHHLGHAASAYALSGFEESAVLVMDGVGAIYDDLGPSERAVAEKCRRYNYETISLYRASGIDITPLEKHFGVWLRPHEGMRSFGSLGGMYSAVAEQIFGDPMEAGQVMGLAPYGAREFPTSEFFKISSGHFNFSDEICKRFPDNTRWPSNQQAYMNLARSVQEALEEAILYLARNLRMMTSARNLCFAGGIALNAVANERLIRESGFQTVYVPAAAEDSGASLGAAFSALWKLTERKTEQVSNVDALGRLYNREEIDLAIDKVPNLKKVHTSDFLDETVERLCIGQLGGWFQGGSEFGPRALGQRSILADARNSNAKNRVNSTVKFRSSFRPFAPSILREHVDGWFELEGADMNSPFMLRVWPFKEDVRARVPAVVHVDGTGRVHTVDERSNPRFYSLLTRFHERTGIPILLNTSFNVQGEPVVETPEDALWCLFLTNLDFCVLGEQVVVKKEATKSLLGLYPKVISKRISQETFVLEDYSAREAFWCWSQSPWGDTRRPLTENQVTFLDWMNGKRNITDLIRFAEREFHGQFNETTTINLLLRLRRLSIIGFGTDPW